ncbi:helix-turn-helix domain-containing protein [Streptomyces klenkii]|nr:helix-turn-helix transcriptional regulator [Streptomyces klenkii]
MTRDWPALADAVKSHRRALKLTQPQLAAEAGVSTSTIQKLESGRGDVLWPNEPPAVLARVEAVFGWEPDTALAILEDGAQAPPPEPRRRSAPRGPVGGGATVTPGMPLSVTSELAGADRAVVQATVVQGPGDTRFAIVWTAGADAAAEELTPEALEQWTRLNRAALGLPSGDQSDA